MCTTWTTRNRANVYNRYTVQTLLVDSSAYCPCGPNHPDYSYRSRLYNPDPKYQGHLDLTCHMYDSIPKDKSCGGYGRPAPPGYNNGNRLPCFANPNTGCWPPNTECMADTDNDCCSPCPTKPPRCKRRQIRPPSWACCKQPKMTLKQWIKQMKEKDQQQRDQCQNMGNEQEECGMPPPNEDDCGDNSEENKYDPSLESEGGYSLEIPRAENYCGAKVSYNCGNTGNCYLRTEQGCCEVTRMTDNGCIMVETDPCGGISSRCMGGPKTDDNPTC